MTGFEDGRLWALPDKPEVGVVGMTGVVAERYGAWTTACGLLQSAFRSFLPSDVLTLAEFLAAADRDEEAEELEEVDVSDIETEPATEREPADEGEFAEPEVRS